MVKKPRTPKQKKFFKNLADGMTNNQAAIKAGYKLGINPQDIINNHKDYWDTLLNKAEVTDDFICQTIKEGMKATKVVGYLQSYKKDEDGKPEKVEPDQTVSNEFVEVADYSTRAKFVDIALKLKSAYPATKHEVAGKDGGPVEVRVVYA